MSAGYADRLSEYENKGVCGLPETFDSSRSLTVKINSLVRMVKEANRIVILTGAGISTSAGIPDFRGPNGIWTNEKKKGQQQQRNNGKKRKRNDLSSGGKQTTTVASENGGDFTSARPTLTHRAIVKLVNLGKVQYVVTQNVDGLHKKSGLSRDHHAVLHGCVFTEKCQDCGTEFYRDFDVGGMSFQPTGRKCSECGGVLRDCLLDWEDDLPEEDWEQAQQEAERADLVLALGTSLRIEPAGSLPTLAKQFVIVNLQKTPYDSKAKLVIRATVDGVMDNLLKQLGYEDWDSNNNENEPTVERQWKRPTP